MYAQISNSIDFLAYKTFLKRSNIVAIKNNKQQLKEWTIKLSVGLLDIGLNVDADFFRFDFFFFFEYFRDFDALIEDWLVRPTMLS